MRLASILVLTVLAACAPIVDPVSADQRGADSFYQQSMSVSGIPLAASDKVTGTTLMRARTILTDMIAHRPEFGDVLASNGYRLAIMAESEAITDLPENANWKKPGPDDPRLTRCERKHYEVRIGQKTDREYWNARTRGIGGLFTVGAEEDVLGRSSSRYYGETIIVHEFAHNILDAIRLSDPALYADVETAYTMALADGLWKDEYASTTVQEYWAEGTQFWFNSNRLAVFNGRKILSHSDLTAYDPRLAAALRAAYGDRHQLADDPFYNHPAGVPSGPIPQNTAEVC